jgi:hypothetical protein
LAGTSVAESSFGIAAGIAVSAIIYTDAPPTSSFVGFGDLSFGPQKKKKRKQPPEPVGKTLREELEEHFTPTPPPLPSIKVEVEVEVEPEETLEASIPEAEAVEAAVEAVAEMPLDSIFEELRALRQDLTLLQADLKQQARRNRRRAQQQLMVS